MEFIRSNKTFLMDVLSDDASFILQQVHSKKNITHRNYKKLHGMLKDCEETATELLDILIGRGDKDCNDFISLLRKKEILDTFPRLTELLTPQQDGPHQQVAESLAPDNSSQEASLDKTYKAFNMTSSPRGVCLIINNVNFKGLNPRKGSKVDAEALKKVFTWLDFTVECHEDLTKDQMKTIIQECSQRAGGDCFVCCVLSHGEAKGVFGSDDEVLPIEDILSPFKGQALAGKPKLFFIQACRGKRFQNEVTIHTDSSHEDDQGLELDANPLETISIPEDADFLVSMSTVNEHYAARHKTEGSWFIQSLCKRLKEGILRGDAISSVLDNVNYDVCQEEGFIWGKKFKQVPIWSSTLRKRLVFPVPRSSDL